MSSSVLPPALAGRSVGRPRPRKLGTAFEPWLYAAPALVLIATVMLVPLVLGLAYSFRKFGAFRSQYV